MKPKHIKQLQTRSRKLKARYLRNGVIAVESQTNDNVSHIVTYQFAPDGTVHATCTCEWAEHNGTACAHVMAALEHLAAIKHRSLSYWENREAAERQKQRIFRLVGTEHSREDDIIWITSRAG